MSFIRICVFLCFALSVAFYMPITSTARTITDPAPQPSNPQVVGGSDATAGEFPWQALLLFDREQAFRCGGTLVAPDWIITAASCIYKGENPYNIKVVLGAHVRDTLSGREQIRGAKTIVHHPNYNSTTLNNDIALVQLTSPVTLNAYVSTIRIANSNDAALYNTGNVTVSGWGQTATESSSNTLQKADLPIVLNPACSTMYTSLLTGSSSGKSITANMFCAGDITTGSLDACPGDSGGPAIKNDSSGRPVLIGVNTTWEEKVCGDPTVPGVFTRVSTLSSFITGKIGRVDVPTVTASMTRTPSLTRTPSITRTPSLTRTSSITRTPSLTRTNTVTRSPNLTRSATNTFTPSSTRTLTNTRTHTLTRSITLTRTPTITPLYFDKITNGSFERLTSGVADGWGAYSSSGYDVYAPSGVIARTGSNVAWLGGGIGETTSISQTVSVDSSGKYLAFYFKTISSETCNASSPKDYLMVIAQTDTLAETLAMIDICKTTVKSTWTKKTFPMTSFVGQSGVVITIVMNNDLTSQSHVFIDDVGFVPSTAGDVNYRLLMSNLAPQTLIAKQRTR